LLWGAGIRKHQPGDLEKAAEAVVDIVKQGDVVKVKESSVVIVSGTRLCEILELCERRSGLPRSRGDVSNAE
jgi:hypothetical protein